ncbi:MAG: hypothetical protein ACLFR0_02790 [Alphaproteobacteria bacterium]
MKRRHNIPFILLPLIIALIIAFTISALYPNKKNIFQIFMVEYGSEEPELEPEQNN